LAQRTIVWYGEFLWSGMQQLLLANAPYGVLVRINGMIDESNCMVSDPGIVVDCETNVGKTYWVGIDDIPDLGTDTKCGEACRHYYTVLVKGG
jgi:hypothetical protein